MRLKLVVIASLLAALLGAGASITIILTLFSSLKALSAPGPLLASTLLLPLGTCLLAAVFVYRHTARRRKVQALLTALLSIFLTIAAFVIASAANTRLKPRPPAPDSQHTATLS